MVRPRRNSLIVHRSIPHDQEATQSRSGLFDASLSRPMREDLLEIARPQDAEFASFADVFGIKQENPKAEWQFGYKPSRRVNRFGLHAWLLQQPSDALEVGGSRLRPTSTGIDRTGSEDLSRSDARQKGLDECGS